MREERGRGDEGMAWDEERLVESTHMFTKGKQNNNKKNHMHAFYLDGWISIDQSISTSRSYGISVLRSELLHCVR